MEGDTKSKQSVKEMEVRLTHLVETNIHDPEIYELLKKLAAIYIFQNRYVYGYSDVDAVCHDVAADTYMRVVTGKTHIEKWMYYIGKSIQLSYISNQRKVEHEVIETEGNPELQKAVIRMCAGSSKSISDDFNSVHKISFLENIDSLIRQTLNSSKFKSKSKDWWTLYTDLCLSLYYDKPIYFRTPPKLKPYVELLIHQFRESFLTSEFAEYTYNEEGEDLPGLIFYDEQAVKDGDRRRDV